MYVCIHTCMQVCMYVCIHTCMYAGMYLCIHTYKHTHKSAQPLTIFGLAGGERVRECAMDEAAGCSGAGTCDRMCSLAIECVLLLSRESS